MCIRDRANILMNKEIIPELLQKEFTVRNLTQHLKKIIDAKPSSEYQQNIDSLISSLGDGNSYENTAKYIEFVLVRLTTIGTIYLTFVALLPEFLLSRTSIPFYLGGTALLIVVVVMIDFITQVQSHLFQHQYEGLLKKTKLKGRR